ncbi:uncharacterized protein M437DRAFT_63680 [Aureobasidium melanogenum CBS 110374]|uniref:F-box domain-containing protein n=1 Tax=Aureobasidium melanogenum (strain CBS 110374) TaxID=1043003 RepID=A0A074VW41_AURM1|nr:uncharacterized protein M437DRAFT_63680 [Aureobasidium melanogenum CBS 110374]KEQ65020.1 hypothetical protein M437DRAFT_63680 [Aureobasidium melanogenum CBS 110374]
MVVSLPQELLLLIASHITGKEEKLTPYTLVNKSWQAAFERGIYSSLVVLSPSDREYVTVSPTKRLKKHGLFLSRLDDITSGPQDWRRARRTYIRRILYRVAVPYWLSPGREKDEDYTYDNICRRENNHAFSTGVCLLFEYLSTWTTQAISLDLALQAENASTGEDNTEPESMPATGNDDAIAHYCAELSPDCTLPRAVCITSLNFPEILTPAMIPGQHTIPDRPCLENRISLPAKLKILSSCGDVLKIQLTDTYNTPSTEPEMLQNNTLATANALSQLPSSIRSFEFCWGSRYSFEIPDVRPPKKDTGPHTLCIALHKVSLQLQHLEIMDMAVFPELFCPDGLQGSFRTFWPHLETLRLARTDDFSPSGSLSRYGDGHSSDETLVERYIDDLYSSLGYAAQRMPRLQNLNLEFGSIAHELKILFRDGQRILRVRVNRHYTPSSRFLEAWRVPGGCLQPCKGRGWQQASYKTWPQICDVH